MLLATVLVALQLACTLTLALPTPNARYGRNARAVHAPRAEGAFQPINLPFLSYNPRISDPSYLMLSMKLPSILGRAVQITSHSWEIGTLTEALLEVYNPTLAPWQYHDASFHSGKNTSAPVEAARIAARSLANYDFQGAPSGGNNATRGYLARHLQSGSTPRALVDGAGSLGDPCALGPAIWMLAHFAKAVGDVGTPLASDSEYAWAVGNQLAYLRQGPRSENGTISQRESHFELWADQGYMIPPFLAYLGLTTNSTTLLEQALDQWSLTSSGLLDTTHNLYRHLNTWDTRFWATGNGWMLAGLMRVLGSIKSAHAAAGGGSGSTGGLAGKVADAEATAARVFKALFDRLDESDRLPNYMGETDPKFTHGDSAGTTAVVGAFYRFLVMRPDLARPMLPAAQRAFTAVVNKVDRDAWLTDVVDPQGTNGFLVYPGQNTRSPEGQSLLGAMWAARTAAGQ